MIRVVSCALALGVITASASAIATEDPIQTRQKLMEANGGAAGLGGAMLKQEAPFSPAAANSVFRTMSAVGYSFGDYFPEGSETGGETRASPKIWEDRAGFEAALAKFRQDADAALAAKPETLEAFQAAFGTVAQNCQTCHEVYRLPEN